MRRERTEGWTHAEGFHDEVVEERVLSANVLGYVEGGALSLPDHFRMEGSLEGGVGSEGGEHVDEDVARDVDVGEEDLVESLKKLESRELPPSSSSSSYPPRRSTRCNLISRKGTGVYLAHSHITLLIDGPVDPFDWADDIALWGSS